MNVDSWPAADDIAVACEFALRDAACSLVADIIDYADIKYNRPEIVRRLKVQLDGRQYTPGSISYVGVPETPFSVRPRPVIPIRDLIVIYAFSTKLAPYLDSMLSPAVLTHRWRLGAVPAACRQGAAVAGRRGAWESGPESENDRFHGAGDYVGESDYCATLKIAASRYSYCAKMDVNSLLENVNVNLLYFEILKSLEENGGGLPGFHASLEALFSIYEFWAREENGHSCTRNFISAEDNVSKFLANFALLELDREMVNGLDEAPGKYYRYFRDVVFFADSEDEVRHTLSATERILRGVGFDARSQRARLMPAGALIDEETEAWLERLAEPGKRAAAARDFVEGGHFDGDVEKWGRPYSRVLEALIAEGDDSYFNQALQTFLHNPTHALLIHNYKYLRHFAARFFFTGAVVVALGRQSVKIPFHNYYLYRLGAYDRGYSPALKELALCDIADPGKQWYWRAGALFALSTFDLPSADLERLEAATAADPHPAVRRAARVVSQQRPAGESAGGNGAEKRTPGPEDYYLEEYFQRVANEEEFARALLEELRDAPVHSADFVDRLHQLDLLKNNAAVKGEFLEVLDEKIAACDLSWTRLLARLEGIRDRRLR
jgi:hypothetical protein